MSFRDNIVESCSGSQGFLYASLREHKIKPLLIHNNSFTHIAGFYGTGAVHVTAFESVFELDSSYKHTCGGITLSSNKFDSVIGCNSTEPAIRVDCATNSSASNY